MFKHVKQWLKRHVDYDVVGEYLDTKDRVHYQKKYIKKYYLKLGKRRIRLWN